MEDTKGHSNIHGGLRGHSIGSHYPITVTYVGKIGEGKWRVWDALTGEIEMNYHHDSCKMAHDFAEWIYNMNYHDIDIDNKKEAA